MAHSCGGGSRSGGYHRGSSRSHYRNTGGYSCRHVNHYRWYSYTNWRGKTKYVYCYENPGQRDPVNRAMLIFYLPIFLVICMNLFKVRETFFIPERLPNRDSQICMEDNLNVIRDEESLRRKFQEVYEVTGITPAVLTVSNESWQRNTLDFEQYALSRYNDLFEDEYHCLIVYSAPKSCRGSRDGSIQYADWKFECIIGDDTGPSVDMRLSHKFSKAIYDGLMEMPDPGEAIEAACDKLLTLRSGSVLALNEDKAALCFLALFAAGFPYILAVIRDFQNFRYRSAVPCGKKQKNNRRRKQVGRYQERTDLQ